MLNKLSANLIKASNIIRNRNFSSRLCTVNDQPPRSFAKSVHFGKVDFDIGPSFPPSNNSIVAEDKDHFTLGAAQDFPPHQNASTYDSTKKSEHRQPAKVRIFPQSARNSQEEEPYSYRD
jgi:hypothetical protein